MREQIFIDTSAWYAFFNIKASAHEKIKGLLNNFRGKLVITNYIFDEIVTLVNVKVGREKAVIVGDILLKSPHVEKEWITPSDEKQAWELFVSRKDKAYSFTDCTSFVVMKRMKLSKCLSLDGHFRQEGFEEI